MPFVRCKIYIIFDGYINFNIIHVINSDMCGQKSMGTENCVNKCVLK